MNNLALRYTASPADLNCSASILRTLADYIRRTEFKRLLNQVCSAQQKEGFKCIAVLSEYSGEGRTFFVSALALAFTRFLNSRVLIVDAATQTKNCSLFLHSIVGTHAADESARLNTLCGYVDLITTKSLQKGPYDCSDFYVGSYLTRLKDQYDVILLDTCPLSMVTEDNIDPLIAAGHAEKAIVVLSEKSLNSEVLGRVRSDMDSVGLDVLGTVYNPNAGMPLVNIQEFISPRGVN